MADFAISGAMAIPGCESIYGTGGISKCKSLESDDYRTQKPSLPNLFDPSAKPAVQSQKAIPPGHSSGAAVTHHYSHARSPTEGPRPKTPSMPTDDAEGLPKSMPIRNLRQHSAMRERVAFTHTQSERHAGESCAGRYVRDDETSVKRCRRARGAGLRYTPVGIWRVGIIEQQESDSQRVLSSGSIP